MNRYPIWVYAFIAVSIVVGVLYSAPNLFGQDPALRVSARRAAPIDAALVQQLESALTANGVAWKVVSRLPDAISIRFEDESDSRRALEVVEAELDGVQYVAALNKVPATPGWLRAIGGKPMYMGLDLQGGVHFQLEVDMAEVESQAIDRFVDDIAVQLREAGIRYESPIEKDSQLGIVVRFRDIDTRLEGLGLIEANLPDLDVDEESAVGALAIRLTVSDEYLLTRREAAMDQNVTTLRNRVNEIGVAEPIVQKQGDSRIVVELPGVDDPTEAKRIIGATATLEFHMVDEVNNVQAAVEGRVPPGSELHQERDGNYVLLKRQVILRGESIIDASSGLEQQTGSPAVFITLDGEGAQRFSRATRDEIGNSIATVYIELIDGRTIEEVINVAVIRDRLGKNFQITGLDSTTEARTLALLLRAGSLAAPVQFVEERTVGPSLGQSNIDRGFRAVQIGMLLVIAFMIIYYRVFGVIADVAVLLNLVFLIALLSMIPGATLTMPGIAGIVLTIGMAVDANVLIFERIREEIRNGNTPQASIHAGFEKAFSTIFDAQITTLIAAVVLFGFGTGPIKGFAVTLSLGIVTSMFTAIVVTRAIVNLLYGRRRVAKLAI